MRVRTVISWDDDDPFPMGSRIDQAFNRVINFCPELTPSGVMRSPELISFNRVVKGEFEVEDMTALLSYGEVVRGRVNGKYGGSDTDQGKSIFQALANLLDVLSDTTRYVTNGLRR